MAAAYLLSQAKKFRALKDQLTKEWPTWKPGGLCPGI